MNDKPDLYFNGGVHWYLHPRFVDVQRPAAYGLYWAMTAWARDNLTDGFVPNTVVASVLAGAVKADPAKDRAELLRVGLLKESDRGGVELHRFLGWNDSAEKVERRRRAARNAADQRWHTEEQEDGSASGMPGASDPHTTVEKNGNGRADRTTTKALSRTTSSKERARRAE